jgi:hypothetical protein
MEPDVVREVAAEMAHGETPGRLRVWKGGGVFEGNALWRCTCPG